MPQLLEEAMYRCYELKGWDIDSSRLKNGTDAFDGSGQAFPILSELLEVLKVVVEEKHFGPELRQNYEGSLVSRISNLTVGSKGAMLDTRLSYNFDLLLDRKVIFEMEELRSSEDKSLMMGFVLSRLTTAIKNRHKKDKNFRHLTLVEEAHRLLSKVEFGDSGSKKAAVEMFTDMLAEVRKYGEGLVIVDQIPNKMAVEVLKNTNTKIIHRIFAKDDKETVGDTMMMDDNQKKFLSDLGVGEAIVFSENTDKPVHIKVDMKQGADTSNNEIAEDDLLARWNKIKCDLSKGVEYKELRILRKKQLPLLQKIVGASLSDDFESWNAFIEELNRFASEKKLDAYAVWRGLVRDIWMRSSLYIKGSKDDSLLRKDDALKQLYEALCENDKDYFEKYNNVIRNLQCFIHKQ